MDGWGGPGLLGAVAKNKENHPDIIYLRERGCDDPRSFYEAKRDSGQNRLGNTNSDYIAIKAGWPVDSELEWSCRGLIEDEGSLFSEGLRTTIGTQYNVALCDWDLTGTQYNAALCDWDLTGTQYNVALCDWDLTGTQYNVALCDWDLSLRRLMSYIYGAPILDVSTSHTTTQHSR